MMRNVAATKRRREQSRCRGGVRCRPGMPSALLRTDQMLHGHPQPGKGPEGLALAITDHEGAGEGLFDRVPHGGAVDETM